jgi:hypothetical protein
MALELASGKPALRHRVSTAALEVREQSADAGSGLTA